MHLPGAIAEPIGGRRLSPIGDGQSGAVVFRLHDDAGDLFLKIGHDAATGLVADETARLRWLSGRFPAPRVVAAGQHDDMAWVLMTGLTGMSAGAHIKADRGRAAPIALAMAGFLQRLHALPIDDCPFDSSVAGRLPEVRRLVDEGLVDTEDFDTEHHGWSARRVLTKVEEMAGYARGRVIVHGDFSLGNLIVDDDGAIVGCIDVGRLGIGDPYRDIFIGWRDLGGFGEAAQQAFLTALGITDLEVPRRELHRALDELF